MGAQPHVGSAGAGHLASHTSPVRLAFGVLLAVLLLVVPGATVARACRLSWPAAVAVGPALTYGVVALAIVPFGAIGIPWNPWTAFFALAVVTVLAACLPMVLNRYRDRDAEAQAVSRGPALIVAAGVLLGAGLIGLAAVKGLPNWQSIPSTWDAVWHANTVRFILDTGQASPTHMGELRNVETHDALYYPSTFHALAAVFSQLTGSAPTTAYTLSSLAAAVWLFPVSAATLTWHLLRSRADEWRTAGAAATAAALSASFTAIPYVEFDTASMPNLAAYGVAVPTMVLVVSALRHRDRIPLAVLALLGVFSVHITGGVVTVLFVVAWWLVDGLWHPVRNRLSDFVTLAIIAVPTVCLLLPQFVGVLQQAEIIVGHAFVTHEGKKRGLIDAVVQHTRHLNDFPIQWALIVLAAIGAVILLVKKVWWPLAVWLLLVVSIVHSSAPFGGPLGDLTGGVQRPLLQRPAPAVGGRDDADGACGRHCGFHAGERGGAGRARAGRPRPRRAPRRLVRRDRCHAGRGQCRRRLALLSAAPLPARREVRLRDHRREGPGGVRVLRHPARRARHHDRQREHRRHGVDVRRFRSPSAVDPLRLSRPAGTGISPLHLLGLRRRRRHRPARRRGGEGAQYPVRADQHTGGAEVHDARRASVAR